jgi:hypothetical protein
MIALANEHNVYEINWQNTMKPLLVNKYSLMEGSKVKQVILTDRYLIVQSVAFGSNETNPKFEIDYTWIFTKGSRTYMNAYHVINHKNSVVELDTDKTLDTLYIIEETGMSLYQLGEARLTLKYIN